MIFEIEDYDGNTLCAFMVPPQFIEEGMNPEDMIEKYKDCDLADVDGDYIFGTDQRLVRIQLEK